MARPAVRMLRTVRAASSETVDMTLPHLGRGGAAAALGRMVAVYHTHQCDVPERTTKPFDALHGPVG
jgi:hypothetical protein